MWLASRAMVEAMDVPRDLSLLVVPGRGSLEQTDDLFEPYRLVDAAGGVVGAVAGYLRDLQAAGLFAGHAALLRDGSAALVPVSVGGRRRLGSSDSGGGAGFLLLDSGQR